MSEIEKMYENTGVEKLCTRPKDLICATFRPDRLYRCTNGCYNCIYLGEYPPFTAEKQIELIKWLIQKDFSDERIIQSNFEKTYYYCSFSQEHQKIFTKFEEALAYIFNYLWQSLAEEERKQIKEILK